MNLVSLLPARLPLESASFAALHCLMACPESVSFATLSCVLSGPESVSFATLSCVIACPELADEMPSLNREPELGSSPKKRVKIFILDMKINIF